MAIAAEVEIKLHKAIAAQAEIAFVRLNLNSNLDAVQSKRDCTRPTPFVPDRLNLPEEIINSHFQCCSRI